MSQNKSVEEVVEEIMQEYDSIPDFDTTDWLYKNFTELVQERQTSQDREREIVEMIIHDYMKALGTVVLPKEVWLWIADINGRYLNKNLTENI